MTAAPGIHWADSLKFRAYMGSWLLLVFGWAMENISLHQFHLKAWTWIAFTISTLTLCAAIVKDWMNPAVAAPFAALNQSNTQTISTASITDAEKKP